MGRYETSDESVWKNFPLVFFLILIHTTLFANSDIPYLELKDTINPGTAHYILQSMDQAERNQAPFIVIELDTPGGLLSSTREIVQRLLKSPLPVVIYIAPSGAHAGSAGALITLAADIAVMAPGTNIGAAHPVLPSGESLDKTMAEKMANDTAAFAKSIAQSKSRNADWAVQAVKESASISAEEALTKGVIDFIAKDRKELLTKLDGYHLKVPKENISLLPSAPFVTYPVVMDLKQRLLSFFTQPNIAYMLMSFGGLCIWIELTHPGLIVPGVLGGISLLLSMIAFQMLPISYGALGLVLLGMGLMVAEIFITSYGVLGVGGVTAFVLGSIFLMDTPVEGFQISLALILPMASFLISIIIALSYLLLKGARHPIQTGLESLVGLNARVQESIQPNQLGSVLVQGELWRAKSTHSGPIERGTQVLVTAREDMVLEVRTIQSEPGENT